MSERQAIARIVRILVELTLLMKGRAMSPEMHAKLLTAARDLDGAADRAIAAHSASDDAAADVINQMQATQAKLKALAGAAAPVVAQQDQGQQQ